MVVIAILAGLMAAGTLILQQARQTQEKTRTQNRLTAIGAGMEQINRAGQLGYHPHTLTSALRGPGATPQPVGQRVGMANDKNVGIETLYVAFRMDGLSLSL